MKWRVWAGRREGGRGELVTVSYWLGRRNEEKGGGGSDLVG